MNCEMCMFIKFTITAKKLVFCPQKACCLQLQTAQGSTGDKSASSGEAGAAKKTQSDVTVAAAAALSAAAVKAKVHCCIVCLCYTCLPVFFYSNS